MHKWKCIYIWHTHTHTHTHTCTHKAGHVHSTRYTQCINAGSHQLKLVKRFIPVQYTTFPPLHPRKCNHTHTHTHTHS